MNPTGKLRISLIALDLDDTLLKEDLTISDYTVSVLQRAAKNGIYIVLCSGRTDNAILPYIRRLDIAGTQQGRFMITQNGTSIFDLHERRAIYSRTLETATLLCAYHMAARYGLICEVYNESTIFTQEENEWTLIDVKLSGLHMEIVPDFERFLHQGFPKMVIPGDPQLLLKLQEELRAELGENAVIFTSKPYFLEILPAHSGKGEALKYLAETRLSLDPDTVMAFGDSMNDESMIRYAAHSTAMINGLDDIKKQARHVTEHSNNEDGIARFIEKYVLA